LLFLAVVLEIRLRRVPEQIWGLKRQLLGMWVWVAAKYHMGSFQFSAVAKGMKSCHRVKFANGEQSASAANASTDFALDTFAIPFPNGVLNCRANGTATTTNTPCFATAEAISTTQIRLKAIAIDLSNKTITQGMAVTVSWEAIGA
jgi:hypothetical protein